MNTERKDLDSPSVTIQEGDNQEGYYVPPYVVKRGAEIGYHCHLYDRFRDKDMGILLTLRNDRVFAEPHRKGKVKKALIMQRLGDADLEFIVEQVQKLLSHFPDKSRRMPSRKALRLDR